MKKCYKFYFNESVLQERFYYKESVISTRLLQEDCFSEY